MKADAAPTAPTDTSEKSDDGETAPSGLAVDLRIALTRVGRRLRAQRGEIEMSEGRLSILTTLNRHGALAPGVLAEHEHVRPPSMTRAINALVELGFVTKVDHATDGRQVVVELTDAGREEVAEVRRRRDMWLALQLENLTIRERDTLAAASDILTRISAL